MFKLRYRKDGKAYYPGRLARKEKRYFARQHGASLAVYEAYACGEAEAMRRNPRPNPYPAGKRHDEWQRGFGEADPLGAFHGRNE